MMPRLLHVEAGPSYRLFLRYDDGSEGEVDVSHLAGRGVFEAWRDESFFRAVVLGPNAEVRWDERIELCPDALYLRLTGKTPEEVMPGLRKAQVGDPGSRIVRKLRT